MTNVNHGIHGAPIGFILHIYGTTLLFHYICVSFSEFTSDIEADLSQSAASASPQIGIAGQFGMEMFQDGWNNVSANYWRGKEGLLQT
jgi:hypothetical protein